MNSMKNFYNKMNYIYIYNYILIKRNFKDRNVNVFFIKRILGSSIIYFAIRINDCYTINMNLQILFNYFCIKRLLK